MSKYYIRGVFGLTGSGKTTFLARAAAEHLKQGKPVFSNFELVGAYKISVENLGRVALPPDSLVLIDEISTVCDCRDWKDFNSDLVYFFSHHRHFKCSVFWASQMFSDADKKIRNVTDRVYHVRRWLFGLSSAYPVEKFQRLEHYQYSEGYDERRIPIIYSPKKYGYMFDTHSIKPLPPVDCVLW